MNMQGFLKQLENIVDGDSLLTSADQTAAYGYDVAEEGHYTPDAVAFPRTDRQIADILKAANHTKTTVIPSGSGSRRFLASSISRGLVLSTSRMNKVLDIDRGSLTATVESGVPMGVLQNALEKEDLLFPPFSHAFEESTAGGNAAISAGGAAINKYGVFKQSVLGMEVITPTGVIMKLGGHTMKNVVGYDLTALFCGAEGTLGIIGILILRLLPLPPCKRLILADFEDYRKACTTLQVLATSETPPAAATILDRWLMEYIASVSQLRISDSAAATVMCQIEGIEEIVDWDLKKSLQTLKTGGAQNIRFIENTREIRKYWHAQSLGLSAMSRTLSCLITGDIALPLESTAGLIKKFHQVAQRYRMNISYAGYHGRGILHPILFAPEKEAGSFHNAKQAFSEIGSLALAAGGRIDGPFRTLGVEKARYNRPSEEHALNLVNGVKRVLDPRNIMKPGGFEVYDLPKGDPKSRTQGFLN